MINQTDNNPENGNMEKLGEALDILQKMSRVDMARGYQKVVAPVIRRHRRQRILRLTQVAAAIAVPVILSIGIAIYNNDSEKISRQENIPVLILGDGQRIGIDTLCSTIGKEQTDIAVIREGDVISFMQVAEETRKEPVTHTLIVPRGTTQNVVLEDGTKITLNAESKLFFPSSFDSELRSVRIEGEAFFSVIPDASRPFVVEAGNQSYEVLGTEFNICAYADIPQIQATLFSGSIAASSNGRRIILEPGQQVEWNETADDFIIREVDTRSVAAWRSGKLIAGYHTLEEVMSAISRWYDINVEYGTDTLRGIEFQGTLDRSEELDVILTVIEKAGQISFKTKKGTITVQPTNN